MKRVWACSLILALAAAPLGGCLTISWQDDSAPPANAVADATPNATSPPAPQKAPCSYSNGWDSTGASREIYGYPKEYQCEKSTQ